MDVINAFDAEIPVPTVASLKQLNDILKEVKIFDDQIRLGVLAELEGITRTKDVKVGIKKILTVLETSRQDEDVPRRFVDLMSNSIAESVSGKF
jgi:vesicle-fusing ATPase